MNVTVSYPEAMKANHEHVTATGRVMVHIGEGGDPGAVLVWVSPEVAAQWIEALTPIAAKAGQQ
jgi:hypothetical protein